MFLEDGEKFCPVWAATQMYYLSSGKNPSQATIKRRELGSIPLYI